MKDKIPNTETLKQKLNEVMNSSLTDFIQTTSSRRDELLGNRRYFVLSIFFIIAAVFGMYFINQNLHAVYKYILFGCTLLWVLVLLLSGRKWMTNTKLLAREMNMAMVPILTNTFDRMLMYTNNTGHAFSTKQLIAESKLLTTPGLEFTSDDMYSIFGPAETTVRELMVHLTSVGADDKPVQTEIFKGVFVVAELPIAVEAEVYISTEGDRQGFTHRTFWSDLLESGEVKETVLEWNDFEKSLHVATTNPAGARELLTPVMMEVIHDWWMEHKTNMRIAFRGTKMYVLLPDASIRIGSSTTSTEQAAVEKYAWSIAQPIWRSLMLADEVRK
jgi:hypothetical protein